MNQLQKDLRRLRSNQAGKGKLSSYSYSWNLIAQPGKKPCTFERSQGLRRVTAV